MDKKILDDSVRSLQIRNLVYGLLNEPLFSHIEIDNVLSAILNLNLSLSDEEIKKRLNSIILAKKNKIDSK